MSQQQSDEHSAEIDDAVNGEAEALRREVARYLGKAAFPGDAARIQAVAGENDATEEVRRTLARLPEDRTYESVEEVLRAVDAP